MVSFSLVIIFLRVGYRRSQMLIHELKDSLEGKTECMLDVSSAIKELFAAGCSHAESGLEGVVDPPLQASQCTDHQDTRTETLEETGFNRLVHRTDNRATDLGGEFGESSLVDNLS